jgi:uncharacterized protein (DUF2235 family)
MDGTNNQFHVDGNTNVVRLREVLVCDPASQLVFYDPGVGTLPEPGLFTRIGQTLNRWWSLAFGTGLMRNVEEAYSFLMNYWQPGDRVFLFGFSRGAYSARVLAGLLHALGLLPKGSENLVPYLTRLYGGTRTDSSYWKLCNMFRRTFARPIDGIKTRRFPIHFVGVWDTVSSVGWVWDPKTYPYTARNPSVRTIRHAVALDERRAFFRQNLFRRGVRGQDLVEHWFPGVHADVGGGYRENEGSLWRVGFQWMLDQATTHGLRVDQERLKDLLQKPPPPEKPWAEPAHESLTWKWWIAEVVPKFRRSQENVSRLPSCNLGHHRTLEAGALLDRSALLRIRQPGLGYEPPNLCPTFLEKVRSLPVVPDYLAYECTTGG